ncbi:MAG: hypothetical protein V7679_13540 [Parasphingorhabdus sp.]
MLDGKQYILLNLPNSTKLKPYLRAILVLDKDHVEKSIMPELVPSLTGNPISLPEDHGHRAIECTRMIRRNTTLLEHPNVKHEQKDIPVKFQTEAPPQIKPDRLSAQAVLHPGDATRL